MLKKIKQAAKIADRVLVHIFDILKPGVREKEVAAWIRRALKKHGAREAFRIIVASGKRSAKPHGFATQKKINPGEVIMLDFGAKYQGFCSDITRTFVIGKPNQKQKKVYRILFQAQKKAIQKVKDGVKCSTVDAAARDYIKSKGFGKYFKHSIGHGIGHKVHEKPKISQKNQKTLKAGTIVTIEPGIYIKGKWGMRIEDMVLVTKKGCKQLTKSSK